MKLHSRRQFLRKMGRAVLAASLAGHSVSGCSRLFVDRTELERSLKAGVYAPPVSAWDPVWGPPIQWFSRYGGPGDFQGHIRGDATPGIDYDVPKGTPLVVPMTSYLRQIDRDPNGSLYILFNYAFDPSFRITFGHLDEAFVDQRYILAGDILRFLQRPVRALGRMEIVASSGDSGTGPGEYGGVQPPHLHLSLQYWDREKKVLEHLDPDRHGPDGGKPLFWDGETDLDVTVSERVLLLEKTLADIEPELRHWPATGDLVALKGKILEHKFLLGTAGRRAIDSKHFHDMRSLLKRVALEEKIYGPGTAVYRLMLKIVGYSTDEKQKLILTLPFISPNLNRRFRKSVYEEGPFFMIRSGRG